MASLRDFVTTNYRSSPMLHINLNISPLFDLINGNYYKGADGVTYLNGGMSDNNALAGGNNTQKTGKIVFELCRFLKRFPLGLVFYYDTESTLDITRIAKQIDKDFGIAGYFFDKIFNKTFIYKNKKDEFDGADYHNFIKGYYKAFKENQGDKTNYMKTVFIADDGGAMEIPIPVMMICDSLTETRFNQATIKFAEEDIDSGGKQNTRDMNFGNLKRVLFEDASDLGGPSGMKLYWVGQVQDVINLTNGPLEKQSVFIRQGKKIAKCPKAILNMPHLGFEILKGLPLKNDQDWLYPSPDGKDTVVINGKENPDLLIYTFTMFRNKGGSSGVQLSFIGSQGGGIQEGLSMYHTLKSYKYWGMQVGSNVSHGCDLLPDVKVGRTTIRKELDTNYKLYRAISICYQMWFMQSFNLTLDKKFIISPEELYQKIIEQGYDWDDMLNTVDYWHCDPSETRPSLSTLELLLIALGERKPYWHNKKLKK